MATGETAGSAFAISVSTAGSCTANATIFHSTAARLFAALAEQLSEERWRTLRSRPQNFQRFGDSNALPDSLRSQGGEAARVNPSRTF